MPSKSRSWLLVIALPSKLRSTTKVLVNTVGWIGCELWEVTRIWFRLNERTFNLLSFPMLSGIEIMALLSRLSSTRDFRFWTSSGRTTRSLLERSNFSSLIKQFGPVQIEVGKFIKRFLSSFKLFKEGGKLGNAMIFGLGFGSKTTASPNLLPPAESVWSLVSFDVCWSALA